MKIESGKIIKGAIAGVVVVAGGNIAQGKFPALVPSTPGAGYLMAGVFIGVAALIGYKLGGKEGAMAAAGVGLATTLIYMKGSAAAQASTLPAGTVA